MPKLLTRRNSLIALAALAVAAIAAFALGREKPPQYETAVVRRGDLEVTISESGKIEPKEYVDVGAQVSGQLKSFLFNVGDKVKKGDLLAEIDETLAKSKVEADQAQLKELQASRAQQEATLSLSKAEAARAKMLHDADAISLAEYQAAAADLKVQTAKLAQLDAQIERQQSTLTGDLASLSYTKIYAPMSGTIVSQSAVVGQTLNANQTTPTILRIADLSVMTVEADVSEADVLRVRSGQEAYFTTIGDMTKKWETTVRQVLPQPETVNDVVLYKALLDVENKNDTLKPDMTAQVFFVIGRAKNAVLAPVAALREAPDFAAGRGRRKSGESGESAEAGGAPSRSDGAIMAARAAEPPARVKDWAERRAAMQKILAERPDAQRKMVLVMQNGKPAPRPVLVGLQNRADAEILYGLEPGDEVVTGEAVVIPKDARAGSGGRRPMGGGFRRRG
ncbi:MAG: efflux RND transporter periplasmic adaptor subunit [Alphaproteobacteria bacterium]|nr:efflux RND transporter periplasmic adaptor subunit [Alphaproteobacteria bacterium]